MTIPSFGFPGERPQRCKAHMLEGMVRGFRTAPGICVCELLTCTVSFIGKPHWWHMYGRRLHDAALIRLSGTAATAVPGAHAGGHGAWLCSGHRYLCLQLLTCDIHASRWI